MYADQRDRFLLIKTNNFFIPSNYNQNFKAGKKPTCIEIITNNQFKIFAN